MFQTKSETFDRQVPVAMAALGQHMHEHQLRAPLNIDFHRDAERIEIRVIGDPAEQAAWLASVVIEKETNEAVHPSGYVRTSWLVRLPAMELLLFELVTMRPAPLQAVSA